MLLEQMFPVSSQFLVTHTLPVQAVIPVVTQQSEVCVQLPPAVTQPDAHRWLVHMLEQHWLAVVQLTPSPEHAPAEPQTMLVHTVEQHWFAAVHAVPLGKQVVP